MKYQKEAFKIKTRKNKPNLLWTMKTMLFEPKQVNANQKVVLQIKQCKINCFFLMVKPKQGISNQNKGMDKISYEIVKWGIII